MSPHGSTRDKNAACLPALACTSHALQQRFLHAERENIHLPLDPEKTYTLRLTLAARRPVSALL